MAYLWPANVSLLWTRLNAPSEDEDEGVRPELEPYGDLGRG
jgi:hypothetical protein